MSVVVHDNISYLLQPSNSPRDHETNLFPHDYPSVRRNDKLAGFHEEKANRWMQPVDQVTVAHSHTTSPQYRFVVRGIHRSASVNEFFVWHQIEASTRHTYRRFIFFCFI